MVDCANQENCDLFVVAGDLLERTKRIAQQDIKQLVHILSRFHGTVVILLGTHDYYSPAEVGGVLGLALHFAAKEKKDG